MYPSRLSTLRWRVRLARSRIHLDIETGDREAEAVHLKKFGAKRIGLVRGR